MAETLTDPMLGRLIDGRYEVRERVASGGMATVYLALDKRLERLVAVKVMHASLGTDAERIEFAARFRREAKAAARLTHPGMVRVYDQGTDGDLSYLTMEYVEGENLRSRLAHEATLPVGEALGLIEAVLDALGAAHRLGLVHRDVKPENILIDEEGRPRLADFGLARAVTEVTATSTGTVMGTVAYLAPELVQRGEADTRTDVYATGILLFEALTGRQPFTASSAIEVAARHVHEDVPAPSTYVPWLPAELDRLVTTLAARDPQRRPSNAAAALALVRQTRAMIDEPTLDKRADPPSGVIALVHDETAIIDHTPTGSTIALPIGLGEHPFNRAEIDVIDDDPEAVEPVKGQRKLALWVAAVVVALMLFGGLATWWYTTQGPGAYTTVPPVAGKTSDEARDIMRSADLGAIVLFDFSDDVPAGYVVSTTPGAQEQIAKGDDVEIVVSKGPRMSTVPDVVQMLESDAIDALDDLGFTVGTKDRVYHDTIPEGEVMSTSPAADEVVRHDTAVALTISNGPMPIQVPDLIGQTESDARLRLADDAMTVIVVYERTLESDKGEVFKTDPAPNAESKRTATITLYVSEGKPLVTVPNFIFLTVAEARAKAEELGLELDLSQRWIFSGPVKDDKIISDQREEPSTQVEVGTTIHLVYDAK